MDAFCRPPCQVSFVIRLSLTVNEIPKPKDSKCHLAKFYLFYSIHGMAQLPHGLFFRQCRLNKGLLQ